MNFSLISIFMFILSITLIFKIQSKRQFFQDGFIFIILPALVFLLGSLTIWSRADIVPEEILRVATLLFFVFIIDKIPANRFTCILLARILSIAVILFCFYQIATQEYVLIDGNPRLKGFLVHPNPFGLFLVMLAAFTARFSLITRNPVDWLLSTTLFAQYLFVMNGGAFVFIVSLLALWFLKKYKVKGFLAIAVIVPVTILLLYYLPLTFKHRIDELILEGIIPKNTYPENSLQWRFFMWGYLIIFWLKSPVLGFGPGSIQILHGNTGVFTALDPHNILLHLLFEYGLLGIVVGVLVLRRLLSKAGDPFSRQLLFSFLSAALFDNFYRASILVVFLLILMRQTDYLGELREKNVSLLPALN